MTDSRERLLKAMIFKIAEKGYTAATVDEVCVNAGVTKGAFFHHFPSKESLTIAAVNYWSEKCAAFYKSGSFNALKDPLQRFLGYLTFRKESLQVPVASIGSVFGMMVREISGTHPEICVTCRECIEDQYRRVESDIRAAYELYGVDGRWSPSGLAMLTHSVLQGLHVLAPNKGDVALARASLDHLCHYIELLFRKTRLKRPQTK